MKLNFLLGALGFISLASSKTVMLIRHGEKINDELTYLSPRGKARADCLVNVFGNNGTYVSPHKIYAQKPTNKQPSTRPRDTVIPLANALGLQVDLSFKSDKTKDLSESLFNDLGDITLVSWSNDNIPKIAKKFGIENPPDWNSDTFDDIWILYDGVTPYLKSEQTTDTGAVTDGTTTGTTAGTVDTTSTTLTKRQTYTGTSGYTLIIQKQNIDQCISENTSKYVTNNNEAGNSTSGTSSLLNLSLFSKLIGLVVLFVIYH